MRVRFPKLGWPSPSMAVAVIALFAALGGSGYAASHLASDSKPRAVAANGNSGTCCQAGPRGRTGRRGKTGPRGRTGATGPQGAAGANGTNGTNGTNGIDGAAGAAGATGATGPVGLAEIAQFFALMPPDNAATVAVGAALDFPQDGPTTGSITRIGVDTFDLPTIGTYRVTFSASITEAGQLALSLNGTELPYTVVGRATGTSIISGESLITTTLANSVLSVVNPAGNSTALTVTPLAGGTSPSSATLIIERVS